jgi:hypothetical protein
VRLVVGRGDETAGLPFDSLVHLVAAARVDGEASRAVGAVEDGLDRLVPGQAPKGELYGDDADVTGMAGTIRIS